MIIIYQVLLSILELIILQTSLFEIQKIILIIGNILKFLILTSMKTSATRFKAMN